MFSRKQGNKRKPFQK